MTDDLRLKDYWKEVSVDEACEATVKPGLAIVSHPDDEGIRNNNGRPGAKHGPRRIKDYLGRLVVKKKTSPLYLIKDIAKSKSLAARHEQAEAILRALFEAGHRVVSIGGGHDYGYPDAAAYFDVRGQKILNIDAHLDVRPVTKRIGSGTPFRRFVERFGGENLVEWGLQPQANSEAHIHWAKKKGVKLYSFRDPWPKLRGEIGLSVCLDAFAGLRGVSAPAFVGPSCDDGLALVAHYAEKSSWMGVYESAPSLDPLTEDSARYAAILIFHFLYRGKFYEGRIF